MNTAVNDMNSRRPMGRVDGIAFRNLETDRDASVAIGNSEADATPCNHETTEGANARNDAERVWRAVYEPVERAIVEEHERRVANRVRRQKESAEEEKRAKGDLLEVTEGFSAVWERESWTYEKMAAWANGNLLILSCLAEAVRKKATLLIDRLRHAERRPMYYEAENARRRALAEKRRRIRKRTTTNPCPTREQILDGWLHRSDSHEATIRFGSLMMDLECHVDNSLVLDDDGAIAGRRGGIKRWLQENIPALYLRYTTVMRYKAAAQKLRQIAEIRDPVPAAVIVDPPFEVEESGGMGLRSGRIANDAHASGENGKVAGGCANADGVRLLCGRNTIAVASINGEDAEDTGLQCGRHSVANARAVWKEVVAGIGSTPTALMARIDALLDPQRVEEESGMLAEWRKRHGAEIAERAKSHGGRPQKWMRLADSGKSHQMA